MAKKTFDINRRSKPMTEVVQEFKGEKETEDAIKIFESNPTIENKERAVEAIKADKALTLASDELLDQIQDLFIKAFTSNTLPTTYLDLKKEAKYLADLNQVSGLYMAQRLVIIRDKKLYEEDGYSDFKLFIESELTLSKSSVYNYIDIIDQFVSKELNANIEVFSNNRSKLIPFLPLLKSDKINDETKDKIRKQVINELDSKSFRELTKEASVMKVEYGLTKEKGSLQPNTKSELNHDALTSSIKGMYESIKLLSHPKANDAFLLVLEHLEMNGLISGKELGSLAQEFNKFSLEDE